MVDDILRQPIFTLTAGELIDLLAEKLGHGCQSEKEAGITNKKYVHSLGELARILGCSTTTVSVKKKKGVFGDAIKQKGRLLQIDVDLAQEKFWNSKRK